MQHRNVPSAKQWFEIRAGATPEEAATILIYDYIGWGGVMAQDFVAQLGALKAEQITVALNTPGGDVFDGLAIYNALKLHKAEVTIRIDALAASIGSIIAMAGDKVTMAESAFMMIHKPWAIVVGNDTDMTEMAATLTKVGGSLSKIYQDKAGLSAKAVSSIMEAETWYTAEEAKAAGFVDSVFGGKEAAAEEKMAARFDLAGLGYEKAPKAYVERIRVVQGETDMSQEAERSARWRRRLALVESGERSR